MNQKRSLFGFASAAGLLGLVLAMPLAAADMGMIGVRQERVTVTEDAQKAIILHNLEEEVLILGTDLRASKKTGILRFIPFPSEPAVGLAPEGAFEKAAALIKKYGLKYQHMTQSKGGPPGSASTGVEMRFNKKLGAHDLTTIKVNDVSEFRKWVNDYFKSKGLPLKDSYPEEEAVVDDYVKRGIVYFVLDFVEISPDVRFIEPVAYRFKSRTLYYPLKTSNTFGGQGVIEWIIIAPTTLCTASQRPYTKDYAAYVKETGTPCFGLQADASTSALLVMEEGDLKGIYPEGECFFNCRKAILQVIRYEGPYSFTEDINVDVSKGLPNAVGAYELKEDQEFPWSEALGDKKSFADEALKNRCSLKPDQGPCKGLFTKYYFDPVSKECKEFIWGGCGGVVPFETKEECEKCKVRADQPERLLGLSTDFDKGEITIEVAGSGCTQKEDFRFEFKDNVLTIIRIRPDACKAMPEKVRFIYELKDIGINRHRPFLVSNPFIVNHNIAK